MVRVPRSSRNAEIANTNRFTKRFKIGDESRHHNLEKVLVRLHFDFQTLKVRAALKFFIRKVPSASIKAAKSVIRRGGGKQNIAMTLTVTVALTFVLLRPMLQAVMIGDQ